MGNRVIQFCLFSYFVSFGEERQRRKPDASETCCAISLFLKVLSYVAILLMAQEIVWDL